MADLASRIGATESSGNYQALGPIITDPHNSYFGDRAYGKYQVMGKNIPQWTQEILGKQMTPQEFLSDQQAQDTVAQKRLGQYAAKTGNESDAAAMWFSGRPLAQSANAKDQLGTSTQDYVNNVQGSSGSVSGGYKKLSHEQLIQNIHAMEQQGAKPQEVQAYLDSQNQRSPIQSAVAPAIAQASDGTQPASPSQGTSQNPLGGIATPGSFLGDLGNTLTDTFKGLANTATSASTGQFDHPIISSLLQGGGALANGVTGIGKNLLEHTPVIGPGVQAAEKGVGAAFNALGNTSIGKSIGGAVSGFTSKHPELSGDIGGAIDIASLVPTFKGVSSLAKIPGAAIDAAKVGGNTIKAGEELKAAITTKSARGALANSEARGLSPLKELTGNKDYLPAVVKREGKAVYDSEDAISKLNKAIDNEDNMLETQLGRVVKEKGVGVDLNEVEQNVLKDMSSQYTLSGNHDAAIKAVQDYFKSVKNSSQGRRFIDLTELNKIKRDVRKAVFNQGGDVASSLTKEIRYNTGQSLMRQIEDIAAHSGVKDIGDIRALNKSIGTKVEALKVLAAVNGKTVQQSAGFLKEMFRDVAGAGAEALGSMAGVPFASTLAGRGLVGAFMGKGIPNTAVRALKNRKSIPGLIGKGAANLGAGIGAQAISPSTTQP